MLDANEGIKTVVLCLLSRIATIMSCTNEEESTVIISNQPPMMKISSPLHPSKHPPIRHSPISTKTSIFLNKLRRKIVVKPFGMLEPKTGSSNFV